LSNNCFAFENKYSEAADVARIATIFVQIWQVEEIELHNYSTNVMDFYSEKLHLYSNIV
jgi:hypothetical protein